jgi:signal transduction histidine kinase
VRRRQGILFVAIGGAITAIAVAWGVSHSALPRADLLAALRAATVASTVGVACLIWWRRPSDRFGPLLAVLGFAFGLSSLTASSDPTVFTLGRFVVAAMWVLLTYVFLSLPHGVIEDVRVRRIPQAMAAATAAVWVPLLLFAERAPAGGPFVRCDGECPGNPLAVVDGGSWLASAATALGAALPVAGLAATAIVLAIRAWNAGPLERRTLVPPLVAMAGLLAAGTPYTALRQAEVAGTLVELLGALSILCTVLLPWSLLLGMVQGRMFVGRAVQRLLARLSDERPTPARVRAVLADTLKDPTLELAYWLADRECYVDAWGKLVEVPPSGSDRAATKVGTNGTPLAAMIHDPALLEHPDLLEAASAAAQLSLKNARLEADLRRSIRDLRESRARIASAADAERRRVERDIHDGAQQRLIALQVRLGLAADLVEEHEDDAAAEMMKKLSVEAQSALDDLRELVHGIYPPLLTDRGLPAVLEAIARDAPLQASVDAQGIGRFSEETEAAVYFCSVEAVQNATKHAGSDAHVLISLHQDNGDLTFEVADDGHGFDGRGPLGDGLRNMRDRISAAGGELEIASAVGRGTRVRGRLPALAAANGPRRR